MKIHQKGFLLITLSQVEDIWDYILVERALSEYALSGIDAMNTFYVALNELAAAGLIMRIEEKLVNNPAVAREARLAFRYKLSDFGRERMLETGLFMISNGERFPSRERTA
jgi:hypothetical protein